MTSSEEPARSEFLGHSDSFYSSVVLLRNQLARQDANKSFRLNTLPVLSDDSENSSRFLKVKSIKLMNQIVR